ncbi:MAG: response regulator [Anaerolineales bacterium]|jgi:FixJ family two-component response regulator
MQTVWLVDDDLEMITAVQLMLKLLHYESRYFLSARLAAQALMGGERPGALILDVSMPEVSGIDFLEFLRHRSEWKSLPVVMLSSEAADVQVDVALGKGADAYVTKPVSIEELEDALKKAFQAHSES